MKLDGTEISIIIMAVLMFAIGLFAITIEYNMENTKDNERINKYYEEVDTVTEEHIGVRVSQGSGGESKGRKNRSNEESKMVIKTEMLDIEVSKDDLEVVKDNDKAGTFDVITYKAYPKFISSGMEYEVKKYVAYVSE